MSSGAHDIKADFSFVCLRQDEIMGFTDLKKSYNVRHKMAIFGESKVFRATRYPKKYQENAKGIASIALSVLHAKQNADQTQNMVNDAH